jgi:exosortase
MKAMENFRGLALPVLIGLAWLQLFLRLRTDWAINPQYSYGYLVPLLSAALLWRRWQTRPDAGPASGEMSMWVALVAIAVLFPVRLVEEANPEWRLILWAHAFAVTVFSLALIQHAGGNAWRRHFAFPIFFLLVSVPWPVGIEQAVIQNLMRGVAAVTVDVAGFAGITALQRGNVIEIDAGLVGVDEACSGVRSLQTTLMTALFLGELYSFNARRRLALVVAGVLIAIPANVVRTFFLVWVAARHGFDALHRAHDGAGMVVIAMVLPALAGVAAWLKRGAEARASSFPKVVSETAPRAIGFAHALVFVASIIGADFVTEVWYRAHERDVVANARWSIDWPSGAAEFSDLPISDTSRAMLRCDSAGGAGWADAQANRWRMFFLRWEPGKNSAQLAKGHTPDICLPGTGHRLRAEHATTTVRVGDLSLAFRHYEFDSAGRTLFVFYGLFEDRVSAASTAEDGSVRSRLVAVLRGRRNLGQQVLEIAVEGPAMPQESIARLAEELPKLVRR